MYHFDTRLFTHEKKKRASGECENNEGRTTYLFCHFTTPWLALTYVALNPILGFLSLLFFFFGYI